jgi:hypothetical protein
MNFGLRKNSKIKFKEIPEEIDESEIDLDNPEAMELTWKSIEWSLKKHKDIISKI